jgi:hypothetical protein
MKESFIFNQEPTPEEKDALKDHCVNIRQEAAKPIEGEIEKTPEEIQFIQRINLYMTEELELLEINERPNILPEQIHFLSKKGYENISPKNFVSPALADPVSQVIYFDKAEFGTKSSLYYTPFHEIIHLLAFQKTIANPKEGKLSTIRFGHAMANFRGQKHEHFRGLMEAITDKTAE